MALSGWFAQSGALATTGVTNTANIGGDAGMASGPADHLLIANTSNAGVLIATFSQDGTNYTSGTMRIASKSAINIQDCNINKVKVNYSANAGSYSVLAWRSGRKA